MDTLVIGVTDANFCGKKISTEMCKLSVSQNLIFDQRKTYLKEIGAFMYQQFRSTYSLTL